MVFSPVPVSLSADLRQLKLEGLNEPIELTASHPVYSEDREQFLPASELARGERLKTLTGVAIVEEVRKLPGVWTIYNLEIEDVHQYHVSEKEVLVHNAGPCLTGTAPSASEGVDLVLNYKDDWTAIERVEADAKVAALNEGGGLLVSEVDRSGFDARSAYEELFGPVSPGKDVDHIKDLQVGGENVLSNLQTLNSSVNRSLGNQIALQIRGLPIGTRISSVTIIDRYLL